MDCHSYNNVLDYLKEFFKTRVESPTYLEELIYLIEGSRSEKTVTIRTIYQKYMQYIKENRDVVRVIPGEKEMWIELLDHWQ
ncbi:hypothetical protein ACSSTN_10060 [Pantoea agglomerans]|jgi:hypothetical protein|uniref:hypothetical protein n=1 Tax=Enterobacter agglomerans TaxID=549 RepID=UPI0003B224ED|nr:hypothetical protein [Pantoea agglomerans]ERM07922.1 hypothetical protein L584_06195 [Pantoea agglomerans Tx10]WEC71080.1 hypothetical protein LDO72_11505 [Pantoea agglomerans]